MSPRALHADSAKPETTKQPAEQEAAAFEKQYVHSVYAEIAEHFSATRHTAWPMVVDFLKSLPRGAVVADVGCGNGKYLIAAMEKAKNVGYIIGSDTCSALVTRATTVIGRDGCADLANADVLCLPLRTGICDAAINIAVVHHLSTRERRVAAVRETIRVLRRGGLALIYVWAQEREEDMKPVRGRSKMMMRQFDSQDMLVPWHMRRKKEGAVNDRILEDWDKVYRRYYHVYRKGELEEDLKQIPNISVIRTYFDHQNWCAVISKV